MKKLEAVHLDQNNEAGNADKPKKTVQIEANLTEDETRILNTIRAREMLRSEDVINIENLTADIIDGRRIHLKHGSLGLVNATEIEPKKEAKDVMALLIGEEKLQTGERPAELNAQRAEISAY